MTNNPSAYRQYKEGDKIFYNQKYSEHILTQYMMAQGDNALKFIDQDCIEKQKGIITEIITKLGKNILSGNGIMSVSLPIRIFDERSLLEVFAHQCSLAPYFLEKAKDEENPLDKLKYVSQKLLTVDYRIRYY
jgi:hypothetical protein